MRVEIRRRQLKDGSQTLYLDIYDKGKRPYENLYLSIVPEVDENAKAQNRNAMQKAVAVKAQRMLGVEPDAAPTSNEEINSSMLVLTAYELYIMELEESDNYSTDWIRGNRTTMRLLEYFVEEKHIKATRLLEIDKAFVTRFLSYLSKVSNAIVRRSARKYVQRPVTRWSGTVIKMSLSIVFSADYSFN